MHYEGRTSNYFSNSLTHSQAEQIKKEVDLSIFLSRNTVGLYFLRLNSYTYTPVLVTVG